MIEVGLDTACVDLTQAFERYYADFVWAGAYDGAMSLVGGKEHIKLASLPFEVLEIEDERMGWSSVVIAAMTV